MKIAIVDTVGLMYDGETVFKKGLGGSESAVTLMSRELVKLGFSVVVYNKCQGSVSKPGIYDGVEYRPYSNLPTEIFDIVISSRSVLPFIPDRPTFEKFERPYGWELAEKLQKSKYKILWMHDTFCSGDHLVEPLLVSGHIDEIFTLSDFHTHYVTWLEHGHPRRNFEVLRNKVFETRNGMLEPRPFTNVKEKDYNLFVYNASITKGMIPLVTKIWPEIKKHIPAARLKVIGGFYRFNDEGTSDKAEQDWHNLRKEYEAKNLDIEFTGVIPQAEIFSILQKSIWFIYPAAFPETFGISTLEALAHNNVILGCRFGALGETATENSSYLIDYAIEPNGLWPGINTVEQCDRFVQMVVQAYNTPYLVQQKAYNGNIVKDICTWDTVALQWKQHFSKKLGYYMQIGEHRRAQQINAKVHKVFGRRFANKEEIVYPKLPEQKISCIVPFYNNEQYIARCIYSIAAQDYNNYQVYLIDDASTDKTEMVIADTLKSLPEYIANKFIYTRNYSNYGAVRNQVENIRTLDDNEIIMLIDGDDALAPNPDIFDMYNNMFHEGTEFSYGSMWSLVDNIPLIAQPYPPDIAENKQYREYKFNWNMPYTHLRAFRKYLINDIPDKNFKDDDDNWYRAGGDNAVFYNILEQADPAKIEVVSDIVYLYNDCNPNNDYKVNAELQNRTADLILQKRSILPEKKKILIAIPTAKYIESATFKSIYDLEIPDGCEVEFQTFYGYRVDQVRNLIANWVENKFDYLFAVDHDITFPPDTLKRLLVADKDIISGIYIQRIQDQHILEIWDNNGPMDIEKIDGKGIIPVHACGFGCVLVKKEVFTSIGYPQFEYHVALDHKNTFSEDHDFCKKAKEKGFGIWADTSIKCDHIGSYTFSVKKKLDAVRNRLIELGNQDLLPMTHFQYLLDLSNTFKPKVIYDIGACVLHWTKKAKVAWPESKFYCFEAMAETEFLYQTPEIAGYNNGVLTDVDNKPIEFYENLMHPGGNSYYKENSDIVPNVDEYFPEMSKKKFIGKTLDTVVREKNFELPDLIKMDVQGSELDILKGADMCLEHAEHLILELQVVEYNKGAPRREEVIEYLKTKNFHLVGNGPFVDAGPDGDYHFRKFQDPGQTF